MSKTLRLILGDQLNINHSWFKETNENIIYLMMEVKQEQEYVKHHVQKIVGFFIAMRSFADNLNDLGHQVVYQKLDDLDNKQSFEANIRQLIKTLKIQKFEYQLPDEYRLDVQLKEICENLAIETKSFDTEHFFTERDEVLEFFSGKRQYLMENFYRNMRKKHKILVDEDLKPIGDKWNFDYENRKKYDGKAPLKFPLTFKKDVSEIVKLLNDNGIKHFGKINEKEFRHPTTRAEALNVLTYFCKELLPSFGKYEDAMLKEHDTLFHSCLSLHLISN